MYKSRKGGITVLLCLILVSLIVFTGIFADAVRIMSAERKIQGALNASVMSVLSEYNRELTGDYGIFALEGGTKPDRLNIEFEKYMRANLSQGKGTFNLINYSLETGNGRTGIECFGSLFDNGELKRQIAEYMKYRVPINATMSIIEKFKTAKLSGKLEFAQKEKVVREKRDELNEKIENTNAILDEINRCNEKKGPGRLDALKELVIKAREAGEQIYLPLDEYFESVKEAGQLADELNGKEGYDIKASGGTEFQDVRQKVDVLKERLEADLSKINAAAEKVASLHSENNELNAQLSTLENDLRDRMAEAERLTDKLNELINKTMPKSGKDAIDPDIQHQIEDVKWELEKKNDEIACIKEEIISLKAQVDMNNELIASIENSIDICYTQKIDTSESQCDEAEKPEQGSEKAELEGIVQKLINELGPYLKKMDEEWLISKEEIRAKQAFDAEEYVNMRESSMPDSADESEKYNEYVIGFLKMVNDAVENGRDNLYVVEYVMDRFTYLTAGQGMDHFFEKGEVEYILWGDRDQFADILKTIANIWFLRLAINSTDSFASSIVPHPVLRLVYSLGRGFLQACRDVCILCNGGSISLCPSIPNIKLSYGDHLRMLLLAQAFINEERQLDNIRQLMQTNIIQSTPEFRLKDCSTIVKCKADVSINLWFISLLPLDKFGLNRFEGGRYAIHKELYMGY